MNFFGIREDHLARRTNPSKSANPTDDAFRKGKWLSVSEILAAIAIIVAATPAYWSYECRSTGTFCEGSFAAPTITEKKKDVVLAKLEANGGEQNFDGLSIREAGVWPFAKRYDVVASFKDGTEVAVDSFPVDQISQVLIADKNSLIAVVGRESEASEVKVTAYFPSFKLAKRIFEIAAAFHSGGSIKVSNLTFDASEKSLTMDVVSPSPWLVINNNKSTQFSINHSDADSGPFGATVTVELTDDLHVKKAYDQTNRVAFEKSQEDVANCKKSALGDADLTEGTLVPCYKVQDESLNLRSAALLVFEWKAGQFHQVERVTCDSCYWNYDGANKTLFVTNDRSFTYSQKRGSRQADLWLSIIRVPFNKERTIFVRGDCKGFNVYEMAYADDLTIRFQLTTDCATVTINNTRFDIRPAERKGIEVTQIYRLKLDRDGLPVSLGPERVAADVR